MTYVSDIQLSQHLPELPETKSSPVKRESIRDVTIFYFLLTVTAICNYYSPEIIKYFFFLSLLYLYFKSSNEPFWLAFFLAVSDGVFGFFGKFEVMMELLPGLPSIELGQLYVILSVIKAWKLKKKPKLFFNSFLWALGAYILFLIAQGYVVGIAYSLNMQLRVVKLILPFALFYSIPRLFQNEKDYIAIFQYLFPIAILSLGAQIFTIVQSTSPLEFFGAKEEHRHKILINLTVDADNTYRGIYNEYILLLTYLGALYLLAIRSIRFPKSYLYLVIASVFFCYLLSATRGYVLGFMFIFILFLVFVQRLSLSKTIPIILVAFLALGIVQTVPIIRVQLGNAVERMLTLEALIEGDITAGGTLKRIHVRGPKVMKKWRESPLTGWGFSNTFFRYSDMHVANQTMLMHSGVLGTFLMLSFFIFFNFKLLLQSLTLRHDNLYKGALLVIAIFFAGWFIIHSSTQYYFSYYFQCSGVALLIATFFCFGGKVYNLSKEYSAHD